MLSTVLLRSPAARQIMCRATCAMSQGSRKLSSSGLPSGPAGAFAPAKPIRRTPPQALASILGALDMKPAGRRDSVVTGARVRRGSRKSTPVVDVDDAPTEEADGPADVTFLDEEEEEREVYVKPASAAHKAFGALGLEDLFTSRLPGVGIVTPTEVQQRAIPAILTGSNAAIASYTGSGKTLSYILPALQMAVKQAEELLQSVDPSERAKLGPTVIVVAPSRELAMQIMQVARDILPEEARHAVQQLIGGANLKRQDEALRTHQPIMVVGTPGRLAEHSRRGTLGTHRTGIMVLDEADQLLAPNFREDMLRLTQHIGKRVEGGRQTVLVSATLTPGVIKSAAKWCPDPELIFTQGHIPAADDDFAAAADKKERASPGSSPAPVDEAPSWGWGSSAGGIFSKAEGSAAAGVGNQDAVPTMPPGLEHMYVVAPFRHKVDAVRRAIHATGAQRALVFMNFQQRIKDAEAKLASRGMPVAGLHGELTAMQRRNILQGFRNGKYRALIVSDIAARGLDVQDCDAVINLELPSEATHYAHRAGRTGRAGRDGVVVTVVTGGEKHVVDKLSKRLHIDIKESEVAHGKIGTPNSPRASSSSKGSSADE